MELPEHDKIKALNGANQTVGEFLEWMELQGFVVCVDINAEKPERDCKYFPANKRREQLIAGFFDIDEHKLEAEKRQILEAFRNQKAEAPQ